MNKIVYVIAIVFITSCGQTNTSDNESSLNRTNDSSTSTIKNNIKEKIRFDNIEQVINDTSWTRWVSISSSLIGVIFSKDTLSYIYHGQCIYQYPIKSEGDGITMYWDWIEDCVFDRGLKKTFGLKKIPKIGEPFAKYELLNDTTLKATYFYSKWVELFNKTSGEKDTIYPTILLAKQWRY